MSIVILNQLSNSGSSDCRKAHDIATLGLPFHHLATEIFYILVYLEARKFKFIKKQSIINYLLIRIALIFENNVNF